MNDENKSKNAFNNLNEAERDLNDRIRKKYGEHYQSELQRKVDLIYEVDIYNPEAVKMWNTVKDLEWIKPEIREKWEIKLKEAKEKGIEING